MLESNTQVLSIKILGLDLTYTRKVMDGNIKMLFIKMPTFVMTDSKFIINVPVRTRQYKSRVFFFRSLSLIITVKSKQYRTFTSSQMLQFMQTTCDIEMIQNYQKR